MFKARFGGSRSELKKLDAFSALKNAEKFEAPILIIHDEQNRDVDIRHSDELEKALKKNGRKCEYLRIEGEEHSSQKKRFMRYNKIKTFLSEYL